MTTHNTYQPNWGPNRQYHGENDEKKDTHNHGNYSMPGATGGTHAYGGQSGNGMQPGFPSFHSQYGQSSGQYQDSYPCPRTDMQFMMQMMIQLGNQLGHLTRVIEQNNALLQSIHDQEDTKCVQGAGGGAIIVRM